MWLCSFFCRCCNRQQERYLSRCYYYFSAPFFCRTEKSSSLKKTWRNLIVGRHLSMHQSKIEKKMRSRIQIMIKAVACHFSCFLPESWTLKGNMEKSFSFPSESNYTENVALSHYIIYKKRSVSQLIELRMQYL